MKRPHHDPVSEIESLLHPPIPVVDINVYVENPGVILEQLQDGDNDIVAESTRLELLGVMEAARPVDGNLALLVAKVLCCFEGSSGVAGTEHVQALDVFLTVETSHVRSVLAMYGRKT